MPLPTKLESDRLYLFAFGPGQGESIIVRVPPAHWMVVDSCRIGGKAAASQVLDLSRDNDSYRGEFACIILTHPHRDHYRKFSQILSGKSWGLVGCNDLRLDDDWDSNPKKQRENEREQIVEEIRAAWKVNPACRLWTWRTATRHVGNANVTVLHPREDWARDNPGADENHLSSAVFLEWKGTRILLGADVTNPHWAEICGEFAGLRLEEHAAMKVAHHASENGVFDGLLSDRVRRFWVATPFSPILPNFADGHGPDQLLRRQAEIYLTGMPMAHDRQMEAPCETTRAELFAGRKPRPVTFQLSRQLVGREVPRHDRKDVNCYVVISADSEGAWRIESCGPGSVRVAR